MPGRGKRAAMDHGRRDGDARGHFIVEQPPGLEAQDRFEPGIERVVVFFFPYSPLNSVMIQRPRWVRFNVSSLRV